MIFLLYNVLFPVILLVMAPYFLLRMARRGGYAKGFSQRFGWYSTGLKKRFQEHPRVWIHAVSVGETYVALRFMEEWRQAQKEVTFVLSVNTSTAHSLAMKMMHPADVLIYFPLDFPLIVARVLRMIQPRMLVLTEGEFWPNLIRQSKANDVPIILINGRLSERSFKGYLRYRCLFGPVLGMVDRFCVQGASDLQRYLALGVEPSTILATGSAKYDVALKEPGNPEKGAAILQEAGLSMSDLILLGGSTWPGEEEILLDYFIKAQARIPALKLVLAPRHAERRDQVVSVIRSRGLVFVQRSKRVITEGLPSVLLLDSTGELRHLYTVASIIFIGKSLTQHGGQNIIEPAVCGKPIIVGPNMENFADIVSEFKNANAIIQINTVAELSRSLDALAADEAFRKKQGECAVRFVSGKRGSVQATVNEARTLLSCRRSA